MIDTEEKLAELLSRLRPAPWLAVDTEADSLHAYPEKLCLLQISFVNADELIDPLARIDLSPLWTEISRHELIFHAADYDLRLLRKNHSFVPEKIFDTMLAARLLGEKEFGLTNLVKNFLGLTLEKGSQKADWARRPLTERMEAYARNDTHHLKPLADILRARLEEKGRLEWHREWCARWIRDSARFEANGNDPWRIKGSHRLGQRPLTVLREVWQWREREALAANRPPFFILNHETLVDIATAAGTGRPWKEILPRHLKARRVQALEDAVEVGLHIPSEEQPEILEFIRPPRQSESEKQRYLQIMRRRDQSAEQLQIDPTLIASRAALLALAEDWERCAPDLMEWQRGLLE
ncbi:MAG: HRDC domain-containing protein [Verrucomicrobiota bacterium]